MSKIDALTEKELRRLSRKDLLYLLIDLSRELEELQETLKTEREAHLEELAETEQIYLKRLARKDRVRSQGKGLFSVFPSGDPPASSEGGADE